MFTIFFIAFRIDNVFPSHAHNTLYDMTPAFPFSFIFGPCSTPFITLNIPVKINFLQTPK